MFLQFLLVGVFGVEKIAKGEMNSSTLRFISDIFNHRVSYDTNRNSKFWFHVNNVRKHFAVDTSTEKTKLNEPNNSKMIENANEHCEVEPVNNNNDIAIVQEQSDIETSIVEGFSPDSIVIPRPINMKTEDALSAKIPFVLIVCTPTSS